MHISDISSQSKQEVNSVGACAEYLSVSNFGEGGGDRLAAGKKQLGT